MKKGRLRRRLGMTTGDFWFCFCGWNWRRKGLDTVLSAMKRLGGNVKLVVAGEDPIEASVFRAMAEGLGDRVLFTGRKVNWAVVAPASDALVFPTRYEPFGLVVTEAMACGLPVLVPEMAGASEVVRRRRDIQVLGSSEDTSQLARRMILLSSRRALVRDLGRANRRDILAFGWEKYARKTVTDYGLGNSLSHCGNNETI